MSEHSELGKDLTGRLVTLRGDTPAPYGLHNLYIVMRDDDPGWATIMHTRRGNVATVRRGRCIPVVDTDTVPSVPSLETLQRVGRAIGNLERKWQARDTD